MKAHKDCDRRCNGICVQSKNVCVPDGEIEAEKCWRMYEEHEKYLQCPECRSNLWFDNQIANRFGFGDIFFCQKCDKVINRSEAIQTIRRLGKMLKKYKAGVAEYEAIPGFLSPRALDTLNAALYKIKSIKEMILALAEKE
jgi:hypothetical protein